MRLPASWLCRLKDRPGWLLAFGLLLLLLLWLLRSWLLGLLLLYVGALVLLGLLGAMRLAQRVLRRLCWTSTADPKGSGSEGHPSSPGISIPGHTYKQADPMIYSQAWLMARGLAITWDNPDIQLFDGAGLPVPSHSLTPGTTYDVRATIWNGSPDAPAINALVRFFYLSFGAGTVRHYIGETYVDVPVKGSPRGPGEARMRWTTPAAGHYCIQAEIEWLDDANPLNNLGQENVNVKKLNSPNATFTFPVRNTFASARVVTLRPDFYSIPRRRPCGERYNRLPRDPYAMHRPGGHGVPAGWTVGIAPQEMRLAPGEERDVSVKVTAPDAFAGTQAININAVSGEVLIGGVTLYVP